MSYFIFHPDTGEQIVIGDDGYVSNEEVRRAIYDFAEIFGAQQYLPMANYSQRQKLSSEHPESEMTVEELAVANAILEFMEKH